jgi:hypothetical protein
MAFTPIKRVLENWSSNKRLKSFFKDQEVINIINQYFQERKNWSTNIVRASSLKQGVLIIKCCRAVISSELRLEESKLRLYIEEKIPKTKIDKIFYKIG